MMSSLPLRSNSAWNAGEVESYLAASRNPLRLSVSSEDCPLIVPLWFMHDDAGFWCATKRHSFIARTIGSSAACGFDISDNTMPYRGVRGQGRVMIVEDDGERVLHALVDRYLPSSESDFARWLQAGVINEVAILIRPEWMTAWDFSQRMRSVVNV